MAATYEPIASTTLGSNASITFSSIAPDWTDLVLVIAPVSPSSLSNTRIHFNGDQTAVYSRTALGGNGSTATSGRVSGFNQLYVDYIGSLPSGVGGPIICHIMSYANTNVYKTVLSIAGAAGSGVDRTVGLWPKTNAITSITADSSMGYLGTGTTASLYGIKAA